MLILFKQEAELSFVVKSEVLKSIDTAVTSIENKPVVSQLFGKPFNRRQKLFNRTGNQFFFAVGNSGSRTSIKNRGKLPFAPKIHFVKKKTRKALLFFSYH